MSSSSTRPIPALEATPRVPIAWKEPTRWGGSKVIVSTKGGLQRIRDVDDVQTVERRADVQHGPLPERRERHPQVAVGVVEPRRRDLADPDGNRSESVTSPDPHPPDRRLLRIEGVDGEGRSAPRPRPNARVCVSRMRSDQAWPTTTGLHGSSKDRNEIPPPPRPRAPRGAPGSRRRSRRGCGARHPPPPPST